MSVLLTLLVNFASPMVPELFNLSILIALSTLGHARTKGSETLVTPTHTECSSDAWDLPPLLSLLRFSALNDFDSRSLFTQPLI